MEDAPRPMPGIGPRDELNSWMDQLDRLMGTPSGPEMARLANLCGTELPSSTLSDIRKRRRIPREDSLDAFVKACVLKADELHVTVPSPLDDLDEWHRLRERAIHSASRDIAQPQDTATVKWFWEVLNRIEKKQEALSASQDALFALVSAISAKDNGPLSAGDHATLLRAVAHLPHPDDRTVLALYRQSVERATGMSAPAPLRDIRDYPALVDELTDYPFTSQHSIHPLLVLCELLVQWFPDTAGAQQLKLLVGSNVARRVDQQPMVNAGHDAAAIVLLEPAHPIGHFLLKVWCYYGRDNVDLTYRSPRAMRLEQLRDELRSVLPDALNVLALRFYDIAATAAPTLVEFVVPLELFGEPVEEWPIGTDGPGVEQIAWHNPVVLRDLSRFREPRLHHTWRGRWLELSDQHAMALQWFTCRADPDQGPAEWFFTPGRPDGPLGFSVSPLIGPYHRRVLGSALKAGAPAILWRREDRYHYGADCDCDKFVELIESAVAGIPLSLLPAAIHALRMTTAGAGPGQVHRIALLWDDPFRWPEPPDRFVDPTRRGAIR